MLNKLFKIRFTKTEYIIKEKEGIVVCFMDWERSYTNPYSNIYTNVDLPFYDTIRTVARCHPEDKFDIRKGKYIAESKAKRAVYKKASKAIRQYSEEIKADLDRLLESADCYEKYALRESEHIMDVSESNR